MAKNAKKTEAKPEMQALTEIQPLASGKVMTEATEKLTVIEQVQSHVLLKKVGEAVEARLKELREPLMAVAKAKGEVSTEKGTKKYVIEGNSICIEYRQAHAPDESKARELLLLKSIPLTEVFDEVKTLVFNPSKLDFLIKTGKISQADYDALIPPPTEAMRVYPSKELKTAVEALGLKSKSKLEEVQPSFEAKK